MSPTRREFIKRVGIAIASLMAARCACVSFVGGSPRDRLRSCWLQLDWLAQQAQEDYKQGERAQKKLAADHRAALDDLVASGELDADVADDLDSAFGSAIVHVVMANTPITCYKTAEPNYIPVSADQLMRQAELLAEMAEDGHMDSAVVAQAQTAVERDITFLALSDEEMRDLRAELWAAAGDSYDFPPFDELDLEVTPEATEAARFLIELLLE
ncbi:MAG: hypothetical protein JXA14_01680 [Anaerolineae bacterium]|nr:hypothetical protein [Anaerolineae bacterium]